MGTVVGAVIDYLVTQLPAPAAAVNPGAIIVDGNTNDEIGPAMIYIGRAQPEDLQAGTNTRIIPVLGTRRVQERISVPCFVDCLADGTAQKTSRDLALALYDVVCHLVANDPGLSGVLSSPYYAQVTNVQLIQPDPPTTAQSRAVLLFDVTAENRYLA